MIECKKSLIYCTLFCFLITIFAIYDIRSGYVNEISATHSRVANTSFLIAEWIKSAFIAPEYVLRDIISKVPVKELQYPHSDPIQYAKITQFLKSKIKTLSSSFVELGMTNKRCVVTHAYTVPPRPSMVGFDGSHRKWCTIFQQNDKITHYVTPMFLSSTGHIIVSYNRPFRTSNLEFQGMAGLSVELGFFSKWLKKVTTGEHGILAIADLNMSLLARKPALPSALGKKVNDKKVEAFIASSAAFKSFRNVSPLDGESRLYGVRKIDGLPFVIVVGEADEDWLKAWHRKTFATVFIVVMFWIYLFLFCVIIGNSCGYKKSYIIWLIRMCLTGSGLTFGCFVHKVEFRDGSYPHPSRLCIVECLLCRASISLSD